jgi:hypothetical protein
LESLSAGTDTFVNTDIDASLSTATNTNNASAIAAPSSGSLLPTKPKVDIHKYFRIVNLQLDVCKVFSTLSKTKTPDLTSIDPTLTLFGTAQAKQGMLSIILYHLQSITLVCDKY